MLYKLELLCLDNTDFNVFGQLAMILHPLFAICPCCHMIWIVVCRNIKFVYHSCCRFRSYGHGNSKRTQHNCPDVYIGV